MLAARRDPIFDHGAHNAPAPTPPGHAAPRPTGFSRFIAGLQILGTVLGIPLGLASGYSIYRANFSVEARCQGLRSNIVSMLDKSADASTLRMLVRRDVLTFEQSCGSVDPNAVAAFKTLLSRNRPATAATVTRATAKKPRAKVAHTAKAAHQPTALSDAKWLSAVREALVRQHRKAAVPSVVRPETARVMREPASTAAIVQPAPAAQPAPVVEAAPIVQPAPTMRATAAPQADSDHPVPPGLIPDVPSQVKAQGGGRPASATSQLPLIGGMFGH